jgi:uncharacterized protein YebE (UPF0316 family)
MNLALLVIIFFAVGLLEMFFWSLNTKALIKDKLPNTFIFTCLGVMIWFFVVSKVAENVNNISLMLGYALGCASGNCITIKIDKHIDKIAKLRFWKRKCKKKIKRAIKKK